VFGQFDGIWHGQSKNLQQLFFFCSAIFFILSEGSVPQKNLCTRKKWKTLKFVCRLEAKTLFYILLLVKFISCRNIWIKKVEKKWRGDAFDEPLFIRTDNIISNQRLKSQNAKKWKIKKIEKEIKWKDRLVDVKAVKREEGILRKWFINSFYIF
jgi:hypothetical protein